MHKGTAFALIAGTVVAGVVAGRAWKGREGGEVAETAGSAEVAGAPAVDRKKVPLEGESRGPADALVNIVVFSDFQCPFCGRVVPTIDKLMKDYDGKLRLFFKHYPLPFHGDAPLASQAALAAGAQGKFWEMHDRLFANQTAIKRPDLERHAQALGLDMAKFKQALDGNVYKARVDADTALGSSVGVNGTPAFFINGRRLSGAMPYTEFKRIIDDELGGGKKTH